MSLLIATPSPARRQVPHLRLVRDVPARPARRRPSDPAGRPASRFAVQSARVLPATRPGDVRVAGRIECDTPVRLTRRGRIVVRIGLGLAVLAAVVAGVLLISRPADAGTTPQPVPVSYRIVLPGQTLWQIAGQVAPGVDRRATVHRIVELNALPSVAVSAGQRIAVPVRSS